MLATVPGANLHKPNVMIRQATQEDFNFIHSLHSIPAVNRFLFYEIMSEEEFTPIFNELVRDNVLHVYMENDTLIGMFKLRRQTHRASHITGLGGVAIHPDFGGKGYGQKMLAEIIALCNEKGVIRLELGVSVINTRAIHLYEKAGFQREGLLRKIIYLKTENLYLDDVVMSYLYV